MKTQNEMRGEFEELEEIRKIMNENGIYFMNHSGWYEAGDFKDFEYEQYINGAWYAFQEQQKRIDTVLNYVSRDGFTPHWVVKELLK